MYQRFITVALLSFGTVLLINSFFRSPETHTAQQVVPGQAYRLPTSADLAKPALRDIDFIDQQVMKGETLTKVSMPLYDAVFSTHGASLDSIAYSQHRGEGGAPIQTIQRSHSGDREQRTFLLALSQETPFTYKQEEIKKTESGKIITYTTHTSDWKIRKSYVLCNDTYQIDVLFSFEPRRHEVRALQPRLFVPAPRMAELKKNETSGVIGTTDGAVDQVALNRILEQAWVTPPMMGTQNTYFTHVLFNDPQHFTQRGYYKQEGAERLTAIYEGPSITEKESYTLSFYIGPKSMKSLRAVDVRLEGVLSFGWFSFLSKPLLQLLNIIYDYVHNYGLAIILLTLLVKLLMLPLSAKGVAYQLKTQKIAPQMAYIRKKYAGNREQSSIEIMKLYKQRGVSPFAPMLSILYQLLQAPIIFALYRALSSSIELYHAPFFGWIKDLSVKDPYFILPLLIFMLMWLQPLGGTQKTDKSAVFSYVFPLIILAFFIGLPAGLVLFVLVNFGFSFFETQIRTHWRRVS